MKNNENWQQIGKNDKKRKEKKEGFCSFHTLSPFKRGKKKISYINGLGKIIFLVILDCLLMLAHLVSSASLI